MDYNFKNKVIIITGSSSGIGAAAAIRFTQLSANVVIVGRNEEKLKNVSKQIEKTGNDYLAIKAEMTVDKDVRNIADKTIEKFGKIDVLVNNAAVGGFSNLQDGMETFDRIMSTNVRSVFLLTSLVVPFLKKTQGNIVNISSIAGVKPVPEFMTYSMSKAALDMFTKCLSRDLAPYKIRVNSVNPGPVKTDFQKTSGLTQQQEEDFYKNRIDRSPLGKIATSEEVADLITFLASDKASSITGNLHLIENGYMYC